MKSQAERLLLQALSERDSQETSRYSPRDAHAYVAPLKKDEAITLVRPVRTTVQLTLLREMSLMKDANVQISSVADSRVPEYEGEVSVRVACSQELRSLHVPGSPLVLCSAWDAGSAQALTEIGAKAIALDAWSVATAHGFDEVEHMPVDLYLSNLQTVTASSHLPVTADLSGFCSTGSSKISDTVARALRAGASGVTIGDVVFGCGALRDIIDQATMISAAKAAADAIGVRPFLYARSDVFYQTWPDQHSESMVALAVEHADAFADAGADSLFVPGLSDLRLIDRLVRQSPLPVSVMISDRAPSIQDLSRSGVACVASGPLPYLTAMSAIRDEVRTLLMPSPQPSVTGLKIGADGDLRVLSR